jgi:hypothetical protein
MVIKFLKKKYIKLLLFSIGIILLIFYLKIFFTNGVYFEDTFLKKEVVNSERFYSGKDIFGNIQITIKERTNTNKSVEVIYDLPNNINRQYTVNFKSENDQYADIENIKDKDGNIVFSGGQYQKIHQLLLGEKEELVFDDNFQVRISGKSPYSNEYKVPLNNVVGFATYSNDIIRGEYNFLFLAIFISAFLLIDIKFPLLFFNLKYMWSVNNPEPSDFYILIQRIFWYITPFIVLILMFIGVT